MKGKGKSNTASRVVMGTVALLAAVMVILVIARRVRSSSKDFPACAAPKDSYNLVRIYKGNGDLDLTMYTLHDDAVSSGILDHAADMGAMPGAAFHKFYMQELCHNHSSGCMGLVLDVGCFIGTHSLVLAKMGFEVHAFDVQGIATDLLQCSADANRLSKLKVVPMGMSDKEGQECLIIPMGALAQNTMVAPKTMAFCDISTKANMTTLDAYWKQELGGRQIYFMKIDVTGHEDYVLQGGKHLFEKAPPPVVLLQFSPMAYKLKGTDSKEFLQRVYGYGYRAYDCQQQIEIPDGDEGVAKLARYTDKMVTTLLLVRKSKYPGELPKFACGY